MKAIYIHNNEAPEVVDICNDMTLISRLLNAKVCEVKPIMLGVSIITDKEAIDKGIGENRIIISPNGVTSINGSMLIVGTNEYNRYRDLDSKEQQNLLEKFSSGVVRL